MKSENDTDDTRRCRATMKHARKHLALQTEVRRSGEVPAETEMTNILTPVRKNCSQFPAIDGPESLDIDRPIARWLA